MVSLPKELSEAAMQNLHVYKTLLPLRVKLQEVLRVLGKTDRLACLDVGASNAMSSYYLRQNGGDWSSVLAAEDTAEIGRELLKDNVHTLEDKLPFEDKSFDRIVVMGGLEGVSDENLFIEECHRVLKPDGQFVLNVSRQKKLTLIPLFQAMLGVSYEKRGWTRSGYTESQLFRILKHGFDVMQVRTYSRFFVEFTDAVIKSIVLIVKGRPGDSSGKIMRCYSVAKFFYELASQLDILLFFTKGFNFIVIAKRRAWLPRNTPVLVDGRSISQAVLSKAVHR